MSMRSALRRSTSSKSTLPNLVAPCLTPFRSAIDQAPDDIRRLLTPVHANTGCSIMVIVTGPMPEDGGAIGSFA